MGVSPSRSAPMLWKTLKLGHRDRTSGFFNTRHLAACLIHSLARCDEYLARSD